MSSLPRDSAATGPGLRIRLGGWLLRRSPTLFEVARFGVWVPRVLFGHPRGRVALLGLVVLAAALAWAIVARPEAWPLWAGLGAALAAAGLALAVVAYARGRLAQAAERAGQTLREELRQALAAQQAHLDRYEAALGDLGARAGRLAEQRESGERVLRRFVTDAVTSALDRTAMVEQTARHGLEALSEALLREQARADEQALGLRAELAEARRQDGDRVGQQIAALQALMATESGRNAANARAAAELAELVGERIRAYRSDLAGMRRALDELRARPVGQTRAQAQALAAQVRELETRLGQNVEDLRGLVAEAEARGAGQARSVGDLSTRLDQTADALRGRISEAEARAIQHAKALAAETAGRLEQAEAGLAETGERITAVDRRVDEAGHRFDFAAQRFDATDERLAALGGRLDAADSRFEAADARLEAAEGRIESVEQTAAEAREAATRLADEAEAAAAAARQSMDAAARARNAAEETGKAALARSASAEEEARRALAAGDKSLRLLARMGGTNAAMARPFDRQVSDEAMGRLEKHWVKVLGLNLSRSAMAYLAHQICLAEDRCEGRIAAPIETVLLRLLALRSLQRDSLEVLEVGTLFGIAAGVLHRLAGARETHVRLTLLDPLEGYYAAGSFDPVTGAPVERRVLERNLAALGVPPQDYRLIQLRSEEPEASEQARDRQYDLVILDGDHSTAGVAHDFETYGPMVKPGGLLLFDDYGSEHWPGIKPYVDEHARNDPDWIWIGGEFRTGIIRRKASAERGARDADSGNVRPLRAERGAR